MQAVGDTEAGGGQGGQRVFRARRSREEQAPLGPQCNDGPSQN